MQNSRVVDRIVDHLCSQGQSKDEVHAFDVMSSFPSMIGDMLSEARGSSSTFAGSPSTCSEDQETKNLSFTALQPYFAVVVQYSRRMDTDALARSLARTIDVSPKRFSIRVAPEEVASDLTGYVRNAG